jgi:hypothetical protein
MLIIESKGADPMKKFISGLILGLLIATASVVAANSEVIAKFTSFNFVVNGESKQLETQPVVVNGSSYLPVRELSNLLGYDVTYKADTKTIELNVNSNTSSTDLSGTGETDGASYEWVSYITLAEEYDLSVTTTNSTNTMTISNGEVTVDIQMPNFKTDGQTATLETDLGKIDAMMINGRTHFRYSDMTNIGLIP